MVFRPELSIDDDGVVDSPDRPRNSGSQVTRGQYCNVVINTAGLGAHIEQNHQDLHTPLRREPAVQTTATAPPARHTLARSPKPATPAPDKIPTSRPPVLPLKPAPVPAVTPPRVRANGLVKCEVCKQWIKTTRLDRHLQRAHPDYKPAATPPSPRPGLNPTAPKRERTRTYAGPARCRQCGVALASAAPENHLPGCSYRRKQTRYKAISPSEQTTNSASPDGHFVGQDQLLPERSLDATRDYAHHYREHGRFGSHPSHDDYGEESES
jgi:hypothetical protein